MTKNDDRLIAAADLFEALHLLTRVPVPMQSDMRGGAAAWAYPLAGLVIGAVAAVVGLTGFALGLPTALCAMLSLTTLVVITGALHEDGFADTIDGFWGGWTQERRLEIMKDSRIGAYGVIALVLGLAARWAAIWMLFDQSATAAAAGIMVASTASRAMMPQVMANLPNAREDGLSARVGDVPLVTALTAFGVAFVAAIVFAGWGGIMALIWAVIVTVAIARLAWIKIGGQTGDVLGATQQLVEIAVLLSLLA